MKQSNNPILTQPIPSLLFYLATPMVFGILSFILFNFTDTYFLSFLGTDCLAAIGFSFPISFITINIALGVGTATETLMARALVKQTHQQASEHFYSGFISALIISLCAYFILSTSAEKILLLMGAQGHILKLSMDYLEIWTLGLPFLMLSNVFISALRSSGNTQIPSLCMFLSALLNLILDKLFIFGFYNIPAMGMKGAAIATVTSWIAIILLTIKHLPFANLNPKASITDIKTLSKRLALKVYKIFKIAVPSISSNLLSPIATAIMTMITAKYGAYAVAAVGFSLRVETIAMSIIIALSTVIVPVVAQNIAKDNTYRVESVFNTVTKFCLTWGLLLFLGFYMTSGTIAKSISSDSAVQELISTFLLIVPISYAFESMTLIYTNFYTAMHKPSIGLTLNFARLIGLFCPLVYFLNPFFGITGIFIAKALSNFMSALIGFYHLQSSITLTSEQEFAIKTPTQS